MYKQCLVWSWSYRVTQNQHVIFIWNLNLKYSYPYRYNFYFLVKMLQHSNIILGVQCAHSQQHNREERTRTTGEKKHIYFYSRKKILILCVMWVCDLICYENYRHVVTSPNEGDSPISLSAVVFVTDTFLIIQSKNRNDSKYIFSQ